MEQTNKRKYAVCPMEFMQRNLNEYCNDMQQLDTLLQQKDKEYIQLLKKQEVLEEENDRLYETEIKNIKLR